MSKEVRLRRGTTTQHSTFTGADGEVTADTTKRCLVLHDGVTPGGKPFDGYLKLDTGIEESWQTLQNGLHIAGSGSDGWALSVTGAIYVDGDVVVGQSITAPVFWASVRAQTYAASVALRFDLAGFWTLALTGDVTFSLLGKAAGATLTVLISAGAATRNLSWPAAMKWVGAAAPATLAANKVGLLHLWCFGPNDSDVVARYLAEP